MVMMMLVVMLAVLSLLSEVILSVGGCRVVGKEGRDVRVGAVRVCYLGAGFVNQAGEGVNEGALS